MVKSLLAHAREVRAAELEGEDGLEGGFTLIELMVVLLIIAILLAIAIPTFLGVTGSAKDRSAQSTDTNALTNLIAFYQNAQTWDADTGNTVASNELATVANQVTSDESLALAQQEPAFTWQGGGTAAKCTTAAAGHCVSVAVSDAASSNDGQAVVLASMSASGTCWFVANLQYGSAANPAGNVTTTGFSNSSNATPAAGQTGVQATGSTPAMISTAGTYYAQLTSAGSNCYAGYVEAHANGWNWGSSFANAPNA